MEDYDSGTPTPKIVLKTLLHLRVLYRNINKLSKEESPPIQGAPVPGTEKTSDY